MIAALRGTLAFKKGDEIVIDVGGVGYELTVTGAVLARANEIGEPISVVVYTDVKENSISLCGFADTLEREVFQLLKKVKGVGTRIGLAIVSALGPEKLLVTIGRQDIAMLTQVPGIGKKLAERMIVELRESVGQLANEVPATLNGQLEQINGIGADAVLALEKLGFNRERARLAVKAAEEQATHHDAGDLVREALRNL